jgi:hypothetical protein
MNGAQLMDGGVIVSQNGKISIPNIQGMTATLRLLERTVSLASQDQIRPLLTAIWTFFTRLQSRNDLS